MVWPKSVEKLKWSCLRKCFHFFIYIPVEVRVKKAQAPYTFVCVPVFVHVYHEQLMLTSPLRLCERRGLADLLRPNPKKVES